MNIDSAICGVSYVPFLDYQLGATPPLGELADIQLHFMVPGDCMLTVLPGQKLFELIPAGILIETRFPFDPPLRTDPHPDGIHNCIRRW